MPLSRPLSRLLELPADARRVVALPEAGHDARSLADLRRDVAALASACAGDRGRCWLVESEDAYRVAVTMLAAATVGARIVLPPNQQPGTLGELRLRSDRVFGSSEWSVDPLAVREAAEGTELPSIDRCEPLVHLFTSGTSGPGKLVVKALCHLEDEVVELERGFGAAIPADTGFVGTVPVQHLYGLLFRVLWPLASGRATSRTSVLLPDELLSRVAELPHAVVVSSPAHLRHLAASPRLREQASRIVEMVSSGGPLETATALALERAIGFAPREIFGSTETGGVASRRASERDPDPRWLPFARVAISRASDDALVVRSPFVTAPQASHPVDSGSWHMGDRVRLEQGGFRLLGRSDRIAKIGEKTLSLPEIEESLAAHPLISAVRVGVWHGPAGDRLGAVVVLSSDGKRRLAELGRRALQRLFADSLLHRWDRVALPRRWRFRDALPADERGKTSSEAVEAELAKPPETQQDALLVGEQDAGGERVLEFVVPRDLTYFAGHYDRFPLVPGVVQIQWVMAALARLLERPVSAERMEAVKFKSVLRPAQSFAMRLRIDGARASFSLDHDGRVFSSGRIHLAP